MTAQGAGHAPCDPVPDRGGAERQRAHDARGDVLLGDGLEAGPGDLAPEQIDVTATGLRPGAAASEVRQQQHPTGAQNPESELTWSQVGSQASQQWTQVGKDELRGPDGLYQKLWDATGHGQG